MAMEQRPRHGRVRDRAAVAHNGRRPDTLSPARFVIGPPALLRVHLRYREREVAMAPARRTDVPRRTDVHRSRPAADRRAEAFARTSARSEAGALRHGAGDSRRSRIAARVAALEACVCDADAHRRAAAIARYR